MNYWLVKSEPETYSWAMFVQDGKTAWTGVRNYAARIHLRAMKKGDQLFFYHSNKGMEIVGVGAVLREAYPDPTSTGDAWVAVDVKPVKKILKPVSLEQIKKEKKLAGMALVRLGRLSVQPITDEEWNMVMKMGGMEA